MSINALLLTWKDAMKNNVLESLLLSEPESALESQMRLQAVFNHALGAILIVDELMRFVDANPAACALTGYTYEELLKLRVPDVTPLSNQGLLNELWHDLISAGRLDSEYQLLCKDGTTTTVEFCAVANIVSPQIGERQLPI
jgi:PAS domain S-box-containing protein